MKIENLILRIIRTIWKEDWEQRKYCIRKEKITITYNSEEWYKLKGNDKFEKAKRLYSKFRLKNFLEKVYKNL